MNLCGHEQGEVERAAKTSGDPRHAGGYMGHADHAAARVDQLVRFGVGEPICVVEKDDRRVDAQLDRFGVEDGDRLDEGQLSRAIVQRAAGFSLRDPAETTSQCATAVSAVSTVL